MRARFLVGRWDLRSEDVGIDSGIGSDIFAECADVVARAKCGGKKGSFRSEVEKWLSQL